MEIGVASQGGGIGNISVNVNASGSSVEGDSNQAAQLGKMLGMAVQANLLNKTTWRFIILMAQTFPSIQPVYGVTKSVEPFVTRTDSRWL